jgi:hypothetical protein
MDVTNNLGDCKADMDFLDYIEAGATAIGVSTDYYDTIEWIVVDDGKVDLRKSLVYCDENAAVG